MTNQRKKKKKIKIIILGIKQREIKKNHVKGKKREGRYLIIAKKEESGKGMRDRDREKRMCMSRNQ